MNMIHAKPLCRLLLFTFFAILFPSVRAFAQWRPIPTIDSVNFFVICANAQYTYLGTRAGEMRRTSDSGRTWEVKNNGLSDSSIFVTLYSEPGLLLLGTGRGAFRSTDNGDSWHAVGLDITDGHVVHQFDRLGSILYMASDSGLAKSTDDGVTWQRSESGLPPERSFLSLAVYNGIVYCGGIGVYRSIDSGLTWSRYMNGMPTRAIAPIVAGQGFDFGAMPSGGLFRFDSAADKWTDVYRQLPRFVSYIGDMVVYHDTIVMAGTDDGFIVSTDRGLNWTKQSDGLPSDIAQVINDVYFRDTEIFIATSLRG